MHRRRALAALIVAATAFGCLKGPSPTSIGANDVRFDLSAQVTGGSSLAITVAYLDQGNTAVQLLQHTVPVSGATQSLPLTIDLTQCLADPIHLSVGSTCELLVTIALSQGGTVVDSTTVGPVVVTPGQVVHATTSVASVGRIDVYPTSLSLTPGAIGILRDTVFGVNGAPIPNASVTWTSADTTIARVNDSGAVTGVAAGIDTRDRVIWRRWHLGAGRRVVADQHRARASGNTVSVLGARRRDDPHECHPHGDLGGHNDGHRV